MNLKVNFILTLSFLFTGQILIGQPQDTESKSILEKVKGKYQAYQTMKIDLGQVIVDVEDGDEKMEATLWLKGDMFKLEYQDQVLMTDTKKYWIYFREDKEVNISDYELEDENSIKPSDIFSLYEKDFQYKLDGTASRGETKYWIIRFNPHDKDVDYHAIKLYINQTDYSIAQAIIIDKEQNQIKFQINKLEPNLNLPDSFFRFNKEEYPVEHVTDQTID